MTPVALALVLASAVAHATWNLMAKRVARGLAFNWLFDAVSVALYAPLALGAALAERPTVGPLEVVFVVGSALLHLAYFALLLRGYRSGDLSVVYPLARGVGPMLSTLAAVALLGERPTAELVRALARELAVALAQRGRAAVDLGRFGAEAVHRGRPIPPAMFARLSAGVADDDAVAWLRAEGIAALIFLEVELYEQVWASRGKRTRVGLAARGRDLEAETAWRVYATPEVEDEPGRGFEQATAVALDALVRAIAGEAPHAPAPTAWRWRW